MNVEKLKYAFMGFAMAAISECSVANEISELDTLVRETVLAERESATLVCEEGMVRADFNLRNMGGSSDNELVEKYEWPYEFCYGSGENYITISIEWDQYYIDVPNRYFTDPAVCKGGFASDGFEVFPLLVSGIDEMDEVYIKMEWSCGTVGCLQDITVKKNELESMCFDPYTQ
jgi:hypothetical protein